MLVSGEAGVGKTALVEAFCRDSAHGSRVLLGQCDDLFAPRPLGPLTDIARICGGPLQKALHSGDRAGAFDAFLDELSRLPWPVIAVIEDAHWADEATIDLIRFVARRLHRLPCLVIVTFRNDLDRDHPLRAALGDLVASNVIRIQLTALSLDAVQAMTGNPAIDPQVLHRATGGNPFFVKEVLAEGSHTVPSTVRDAVLGRARSLSAAGRDALDAAAILRDGGDVHLVSAVAGTTAAAVDECVTRGFLDEVSGQLRFRHDLTRLAIENAIPPLRRRGLHAKALKSIGDEDDLARRAHHALAADDADAVLDLAQRAAARSTALGAHREAAALLGGAMKYVDLLPADQGADLFEARARACERIDEKDEAISAADVVLAHRRSNGDPSQLAVWLTWLGEIRMNSGQAAEARRNVTEAIKLLTPQGDSAYLARALAVLARQHMMMIVEDEDAIDVGLRALEMAERLGLEDIAIHAHETVGSAMASRDEATSLDMLRQNLDRCLAAGLDADAARACHNLGGTLTLAYFPRLAAPYLEQGIAIATLADLPFQHAGLLVQQAWTEFFQGRWDRAIELSEYLLKHRSQTDADRGSALTVVSQVRVRRGDPDPLEPLQEAIDLGFGLESVLIDGLIKVEAAWLANDTARAVVEFSQILTAPIWPAIAWFRGQAALWSRRLHVPTSFGPVGEPFVLHLAGKYREAAAVWHERGCPYEEADALGDSSDETDLRQSLEILQQLGARPRAAQVTRRLREIGVRTLPRGPRASTQASPAGLTIRELEVLSLLCEHLTNSEIADRLVVSTKTVDHHVSAVLSKLSVSSRREAAAAAIARGLSPKNGETATTR